MVISAVGHRFRYSRLAPKACSDHSLRYLFVVRPYVWGVDFLSGALTHPSVSLGLVGNNSIELKTQHSDRMWKRPTKHLLSLLSSPSLEDEDG